MDILTELEKTRAISDPKEAARVQLALRHKLAMQAIGAIRTALNVHRPYFDALLNAERGMADIGIESPLPFHEMMHNKSFALQCRLVAASTKYLDDLNEIADEVITMAVKTRQ